MTDATVSPSVVGLARLKERLPEERLYAVPNGYLPQGLPSLTERKEARQLFGVKEGDIAVGLCGRLAKVKGHEVLLLAAKDVLAKEGRFLFLLLGEGEERRALEALALSLGIADRVRFLGHREVVAPFYHALDIHLSASLSDETASLALAEGMSAGVATVASDCPGNRERVKDGGLFFPAGNAPLLAALLLSLREEEKRRPLSLLALERAKHLPSFAETAEAYSSIYLTLLKEKAQKGS